MHVQSGNHGGITADGGKSMEKRAGKDEPALFTCYPCACSSSSALKLRIARWLQEHCYDIRYLQLRRRKTTNLRDTRSPISRILFQRGNIEEGIRLRKLVRLSLNPLARFFSFHASTVRSSRSFCVTKAVCFILFQREIHIYIYI